MKNYLRNITSPLFVTCKRMPWLNVNPPIKM